MSTSDASTTLDRQIATLKEKLEAGHTKLADLESNNASTEEINKVRLDLENTQAIMDNLLVIRRERSDNNDTILTSYATASDALTKVNELAAKAETLKGTLKRDDDTKKNDINTNIYYGKQYDGYKNLFILITVVCICLIASLLLVYTPLEFLSRPLSIAVCILGGAAIAYRMIEMLLRSSMNYDEFRWIAAPVTDDGIVNANNDSAKIVDISGVSLGTICVGPLCCGEGTEWNSKKGCVLIKPQGVSESTTIDTSLPADTF